MKPKNYVKLQDWPRAGHETGRHEPPDTALLLGTWLNTNVATAGIAKAVVTRVDGNLSLRVFGAGDPAPYDWGEVNLRTVYADSIASGHAISFIAVYDFDFLETELQTNLSKGLLIISSLNTFKDGSARSDYFAREYFYKKPAG